MSNNNTFRATRYLPQAVVATASVVVLPVLVVWLLLADGVVSSPWVGAGLAIVLSSMASVLGSAYWKRRSGPGDVLFSELLLWGWVHRLRSERRLANAIGLLARGRSEDTDESIERRSQLLTQIAAALDAHDSYTDGHSRRVALHAAMIARKMGLSQEDVAKVSTAAAVHDVGKLRIPIEVLNKHDRLTAEEFEIVKRHADEGAEIVSCLEDRAITEMVRHHHERFDGTGYPAGLGGGQIPIGARIIAVADTFDALTSERPYRSAVRHKTALEIIRVVSSTQLDPAAVRAFLKCYSGKRAVLFWTLLAVSPQRALAIVSGRSAGRAGIVPATSIAMPAALATLVVAAVGTAGQAARASVPLRFAQSQPVQLGVVLPLIRTEKRRTTAHASRSRTAPSRQALLGVTTTRTPTSTGPSSHAKTSTGSGHVQSGPGQTVGGSPRPPVPRHGGTGTGTPNRGAGSKKPPSTGVGSHPPTRTTAPPSSSSPPPSSPAGGGNPGGGSPGGSGGGNPGGGSTGGSGGGNPGGGSGGGSGGGNPGGGSGGGGQPGSGPPTKQACFNGGWASHGFPNQGQCVAAFEHSLHR